MNILVTGGAGFIGSRYIKHVYENTAHNIICVDKLTYAADRRRIPSHILNGGNRFVFIKEDICNLQSKSLPEIHMIVNFAAESHVDNSIANGKPFVNANVLGVMNLLQIAREQKSFHKFVQVSTDEVYGDMTEYRTGNDCATEAFPLKPSSYYSATKVAAEHLVTAAHRTYGIPYLITRCCNNYGPSQHGEKFIPVVTNSINAGKSIPVYGKGDQIREWIHTDTHVKIIHELSALREEAETYNIGTGLALTNIDLIDLIAYSLDKTYEIENVADRLGHDRKYSIDCSKLLKRLPHLATELTPNIKNLKSFLDDESRN
jgi:dTDP-glucose 4,6-dehydratase